MSDVGLLGDQIVLEQKRFWRNPDERVLHGRLPDHVPRDLRLAQLERPHRGLGNIRFAQYFVPSIITFGIFSGVLREPRGHAAVPSRDGPAEAGPGDAASAPRVPRRGHRQHAAHRSVALGRRHRHRCRVLRSALLQRAACSRCSSRSRWRRRRVARSGSRSSTLVPNADAAPAIVNFVYFPIVFISGTFFPVDQIVGARAHRVGVPGAPRDPGGVRGLRPVAIGRRASSGATSR